MAPTAPSSLDARLSQTNRQIAEGHYLAAMDQARALANEKVASGPAHALLALAAAMHGDEDTARQALKEVPASTAEKHTEVLLTIGSAWFKLGDLTPAIEYLSAAHGLQAQHPLVNARLGACLLAVGKLDEALPHLKEAVRLMPQSGGSWLNLARAQLAAGANQDALNSLEKAAPLPDKEPDLFSLAQAEALTRLGRKAEAIGALREAVAQGQANAVKVLVNLLASQGEHDEAWHVLREALDTSPDDVDLLELAAEIAQVRGRFGEADRYLDKALQVKPENAALWRQRAMLAGHRLGAEQGRLAADKALELTRDKGGLPHALALNAHAHVLLEEGKHAEAEAAYREGLAIQANCVPLLTGLGRLLMQMGRVDDAMACYEEVKKIAPLQGWSQLIHAREVPDDPAVLEKMAVAAHRPSLDGPVQTHMLFTLAAAWEKKKDYEKAWQFAVEANEATQKKIPYRPEVHRQKVDRIVARFSKAFLESRNAWGHESTVPTFVLGMPRSGTTLVEQILGSHSQVFGAGELSLVGELTQKLDAWEMRLGSKREYPECVDDLTSTELRRFAEKHLAELQAYAPEAQRIVDKLPHNFENIGLIKLLFPNAKILHLKREPRDVAISNFFTDYSAKFGGMGFAYDLSAIGEQLVDHQRMMDHWHRVFPGQILEVDYDSLVEDVEGWAKKIISHLGLAWEDGVLAFQELDRAVKTASVWQVRQPVYKTSKAKWKAYASHLEPLEAALAEIPPAPVALPLPKLEPGLFLSGMDQLKGQQAPAAEQTFRKILQARPAHAASHHFLGAALYSQGKLAEARTAMRRSIELMGPQPQWLQNLANVETALGNTDEAAKLRAKAGNKTEDRPAQAA